MKNPRAIEFALRNRQGRSRYSLPNTPGLHSGSKVQEFKVQSVLELMLVQSFQKPALSPVEVFNRYPSTSLRGAQDRRSVQNVELVDATGPKLALLYWICRRSDKGRGRGRQSR